MTDAIICDRCGAVGKAWRSVGEYDLPTSVTDIEASEDAIDITNPGHLCVNCSRAFARWVKEGDS